MSRSIVLGTLVAAAVVAGAWFVVGPPSRGVRPTPPPDGSTARIYGTSVGRVPPAAPTAPTRRDALRVAREWSAAWTRLTACPGDAPRSLERVLGRSTGALRATLAVSPPRPTGASGGACRPARLERVEVHAVPDGWYAIAVRAGDGLRPLRLRLRPTGGGELRVAAIDF